MKVAYFTPVSPQKTGIADYSEQELIPHLSKYVDLDIFIDKDISPTNEYLMNNFNIYCYKEYEYRKDEYDIPLYHMGNNKLHEFIYDSLIKYPGITVLHDIYLHGFLYSISLSRGNKDRYIDEFSYCYGSKGTDIAKKAIRTGVYPEFEYPLLKRILDSSIGTICHSDFGINKVLKEKSNSFSTKINQAFTVDASDIYNSEIDEWAKSLKLDGRSPVITSFGFISSHKRYHVLLKSFKKFLAYYPNAILILVGQDFMGINKLISELNITQSVLTTGYVSAEYVLKYLNISDFCVNLRYPTAGETSRSVLQIMAAEKPVIVSNVGWFSELPDDSCLKVNVDSYEDDVLLEFMLALSSNEKLKNTIGKNAKNYTLNQHNSEKVAHDHYKDIKNIIYGNEFIFNKISEQLVALNINEEDTDIIKKISNNIYTLL